MTRETISVDANFADDQADTQGETVIRTGKLFTVGAYPDKDFSFDETDLAAAIEHFTPCPVDLGHGTRVPSPLDGKMGTVARIFPSEDGKHVMGEVHLPKWLDAALAGVPQKVSATWDRSTKRLQGLALVTNPRVSDAALMAAFAASTSGDERHETPTGRYAVQRIHDAAVAGGAVCAPPAQMASASEASTIQQTHDLATAAGARCEDLSSDNGYPMFSSVQKTPLTQKKTQPTRSTRMKLSEWFLGKAKEEGVEIDPAEIEAAFSSAPDPEIARLSTEIAARDEALKSLQKIQEQQAAQFAAADDARRAAEAVSFADGALRSYRVPPAARDALVALATRVAQSDATVTFGEGEKATTTLLADFVAALPDLSIFTTGQVKSPEVAALFSTSETAGIDGKAGPVTDERRAALLAHTPAGRAALKTP